MVVLIKEISNGRVKLTIIVNEGSIFDEMNELFEKPTSKFTANVGESCGDYAEITCREL